MQGLILFANYQHCEEHRYKHESDMEPRMKMIYSWITHTVRACRPDNDDMEVIVLKLQEVICWEVYRKLVTQRTTALRAHRYMRS